MKHLLFAISFTILLGHSYCIGQTKGKETGKKTKAPVHNNSNVDLQYDTSFIAGLPELFQKPYTLTDNYILVESDTIYPPNLFPVNKEIAYHGVDQAILQQGLADYSKEQFFLTVKRITYTNLSYKLLRIINDSIISYSREGIAILKPSFVMSEENDGKEHLYFFPLYEHNTDTSSYEFKYADDEIPALYLKIGHKESQTGYTDEEQTLFMTKVKLSAEDK